MPEHRQEFQRELEAIEAKVIELFAVVAEDLSEATRALLRAGGRADGGQPDGGEADGGQPTGVLAERESIIDAVYTEIEQLVNREIALQAPVASDLRFLLSVLRIVPELERSHHLVVDIAGAADLLRSEDLSLTPRCLGLARQMGDLACSMWRDAADSWYQRDRHAAQALRERDHEMGELHAELISELAAGRIALSATMEMTLVARFYDRLGDHAVNIARRVAYLAGSQRPR